MDAARGQEHMIIRPVVLAYHFVCLVGGVSEIEELDGIAR